MAHTPPHRPAPVALPHMERAHATEADLNVATAIMRRMIAAFIPVFHRNALTAKERDAVHEVQDTCAALLARR